MTRTLAARTAELLDRSGSTRRGFLKRLAIVGSALLTAPLDWILRPVTAYAAVCGPATTCSNGYTVFCCTVNRGVNRCPPGTFVGGWWKADGSSYCCDSQGNPRPRYYIDCHPQCNCNCAPGDHLCDESCVDCQCRCNDTNTTCDNRRVCCNYFRYGQCNTQIGCSGPVACRVITCTPPYRIWEACGSTNRSDDFTANQTAPCLSGNCT